MYRATPFLRSVLFSAALIAATTSTHAAEPATVATDRAATLCRSSVEFGPKVIAACRVPADSSARSYRFEAVFDGGHDDTRAGLVVRRDGAAYECESGSKPELDGEYGTVKLVCRVRIAASAEPTQLDFDVTWYHAEYTHVEFHAE